MRKVLGAALLAITSAFPQNPDAGHIEIAGRQAMLTVDAPRPVDSAAMTLAERYGIAVSVEDPVYQHPDTVKDVTVKVVRTPSPGLRVLVPLGGRLRVHFAVNDDGTPQDVSTLLQAIADAANARFPFGWRVDATPGWFTLIPAQTTSAGGRTIASPALLDHKITIAAGTRRVAEHAKMLADALSTQTGFRVSCCQGDLAGYPWGLEFIAFEAHDEPARTVLRRLVASTPGRFHYLQRCDPVSPGRETWCFINLRVLPGPHPPIAPILLPTPGQPNPFFSRP
jgi:hypothetical protein